MLHSFLILAACLLVSVAGLLLFQRAAQLAAIGQHPRIIGELFIPTVLFFEYGVFALPLLLLNVDTAAIHFNVPYGQEFLLLGMMVMFAVAAAYITTFSTVVRMKLRPSNLSTVVSADHSPNAVTEGIDYRVFWFFIALAAVDALVRADLMVAGQYFSWMQSALRIQYGETLSSSEMLLRGSAPLLISLALYFRKRRFVWLYLIGFPIVVALEGSRLTFILMLGAALLTWMYERGATLRLNVALVRRAVVLLLLLGFFFNVAIDARKQYRADPERAFAQPVSFVVNSFAGAVNNVLAGRQDRATASVDLSEAQFANRVTMWSSHFASQLYRYSTGYGPMPLDYFLAETALVVPSALWPGKKPSVDSGNNLGTFFGFAARNNTGNIDPATTVFVAMYPFFGLLGACMLAALIAIPIAIMYRWLLGRWGWLGGIIFIGLVYYFQINANSYSAIFVSLRNALILLVVLYFFSRVRLSYPR